jgi:NAD(P)-dependent dehydrogenase (short-subunit alcohol dehydrogenase family)
MAGQLDDRVILITGGSTGIGRATALCCAREGARVVIADINAGAGADTVAEIEKLGASARYASCDVSRAEEVERVTGDVVAREGRLDGAFNNAGIESDWAATVKCSEENFDRTIAINLKGVWLCLKYQIAAMLDQGTGGSIVSTASVAGLVGSRGGCAYVASKHGVVGLTKTAALEYASKGIRVNAVCPGVIDTPMVDRMIEATGLKRDAFLRQEPIGRLGEPREIGDAVAWLLSDQASFVTGVALPVDGGFVAV